MSIGKATRKGHIVSRLLLVTTFLSAVLLAGHGTCFATTVSLQWDPNTESNIAGYKVYYQADSPTTPFKGTPIDTKTSTTASIPNLDPTHAYYFAVTAYNTSGLESAYSNVVAVAETVPPTVSITSPAASATVSGAVSIAATATDNVGVSKVEFYVNGVLQGSDTATPYIYSWNTSGLAAGTYALMAKAYDASGNVGQSTSVNVSVVTDTTAPTVSLTSPVTGATLTGTVSMTANASDNVGVSKVEYYLNGVLLNATNVAPYTYSWNTATVANGSYTILAKAYDAAGNVGQSGSATVTTSNSVIVPPPVTASGNTIWAQATVPTVVDAGADSSVELGVRFRSDVSGYITGLRFYKAGTNTGTHVGNLWTSTGTKLATATFTSETASGWQQVNFSTPIAISANTVYVASYHANGGHYSDDLNFFASKGVDNGPLHALSNSAAGGNGVYAYGSSSSFPNLTWNSSNYYVDVVFTPATTIWPQTTVPTVVDAGADSSVELGMKFRSDVSGYITGLRFYKASTNTGTHVANLWSSTGTLLATANFANETASGWQQVNFSTPVAISANTVYVASYHTTGGHYSDDMNFFASKGVDSGSLHALANGVSGGNGVYAYGTGSIFPNLTWNTSNYWVDVVFRQ